MQKEPLTSFISHLQQDEEARGHVEKLERSLAAAFGREAESIAAIAAEAGFDIAGWDARPGLDEPGAIKPLSCCGFMTAGTWTVESALDA